MPSVPRTRAYLWAALSPVSNLAQRASWLLDVASTRNTVLVQEMPAPRDLIDRLRDALRREGRVAFAYLFGSAARGDASAGSDVDIALWLADGTEAREWAYRSLLPELMAAGRTNAVDLTILNDAAPALRFAVQKSGELIFESGAEAHAARIAFEQRARKDYWDFKPRLERYARFLRQRLERGGFGA